MENKKFYMIAEKYSVGAWPDRYWSYEEAVRAVEIAMYRTPGTEFYIMEAVSHAVGQIEMKVTTLD